MFNENDINIKVELPQPVYACVYRTLLHFKELILQLCLRLMFEAKHLTSLYFWITSLSTRQKIVLQDLIAFYTNCYAWIFPIKKLFVVSKIIHAIPHPLGSLKKWFSTWATRKRCRGCRQFLNWMSHYQWIATKGATILFYNKGSMHRIKKGWEALL